MPKHCLIPALRSLAGQKGVLEAAMLSTCNRTEVYMVASSPRLGMEALEQFFARAADTHDRPVIPNLTAFNEDAILHLFSVASGFDSVVMGEGQILAQVGDALNVAQLAGTTGPLLNKLFNLGQHCGKRVRSETGISRKAVSVASAAVELAQQYNGIEESSRVLIIGAGQMGTLCAKHVLSKSNVALSVFNPSAARLDSLLQMLKKSKKQVFATTDSGSLSRLCEEADTIFVATGAMEHVLTRAHIGHQHKAQLIFDLSMPRNVDPSLATLPQITLFCVDDMQLVVQRNLAERQRMVERARPILSIVLKQYMDWIQSRANHAIRGDYRAGSTDNTASLCRR